MTSTQEVDQMIENLTKVISNATNLSVPLVKPHHTSIIFPEELKVKIQLRKSLDRCWNRYHLTVTKSLINYLTNSIRADIDRLKNRLKSSMWESVDKRDGYKKMWKTAKIIKKQMKYTPPLKAEDKVYITDNEKAEVLGDQFAISHDITPNYRNRQIDREIRNSINLLENSPPNLIEPSNLTKPAEIKDVLKRLKNKKAPGKDRIPNLVLKRLPLKAIVYMTYIINSFTESIGLVPNAKVEEIKKETKELNALLKDSRPKRKLKAVKRLNI